MTTTQPQHPASSPTEVSSTANKIIAGVLITLCVVLVVVTVYAFLPSANSGNTSGSSISSSREEAVVTGGVQRITLSWGKFNYAPETMVFKKGIPAEITGDLNRLQGCFKSIVIPAFGVQKVISARDPVIRFTPDKVGTFPFSCSMGMGSGTIEVVE